ncbi:MAG: ABC transporter substrate-binding protein [Verrucomicrobia bacterium]|nr:ABC transporter substrate-binding protein [Verrucomicrobiota bacterium]
MILCGLLFSPVPLKAQEPIRIGEVSPLTGGVSQFGISSHQGYLLAFEDLNKAGGIHGSKLELISEDNQSKPGQSATVVRKLITQDKVSALLGDVTSSATLESAPIAQQARIPMITPSATNPRITEVGNFIFRVCFLDKFQGQVIARYAAGALRASRIAIMTDIKQDYSVDLTRFFKDEFVREERTIVREQSYSTGDTDFRAQLSSIRPTKPDLVFVPGYYQEVSLIIRQARQYGFKMPFIGCDGWANQALLDIGGKAVDGCYFTNHFSPDDPAPTVRAFVSAYQNKFGSAPDTFAALGYDAARILADAIGRADPANRMSIRDALAQTSGYPGVTGKISFDASRNASKPALVITIKDLKFEIAERIAP